MTNACLREAHVLRRQASTLRVCQRRCPLRPPHRASEAWHLVDEGDLSVAVPLLMMLPTRIAVVIVAHREPPTLNKLWGPPREPGPHGLVC